MMLSKLAFLAPPPFAPDEVEPGVFVLRQVFDREQIMWRVCKAMFVFMVVIMLLALITKLLSLVWPNTTVWMLNLMVFALPYPLLIVGWLFWTLVSFVRYFSDKSRTREVWIEAHEDGTHDITVNDRCVEGRLCAGEVRIRRGGGLLARAERYLGVYLVAGHRVQLVVCTKDDAELQHWRQRLAIGDAWCGTALTVRGVLAGFW